MRNKKWSVLLATMLVVSLVLAACGSGGKNEGSKSGKGTGEAQEQVLNFLNGDKIPTMDSSLATDTYAFEFLGATMEGLFRLGEGGEAMPGMAEKSSVSEDGLTWTFNLRQDAKWSNGDPVTAHDFVYAWQRAVNPETGSEYGPYMMSGVIKNAEAVSIGEVPVEELGVKAVDDYTFEVQLEHPTPYFQSLTTFGTFLPLNQKFVEEQGDKFALSTESLVFNGPFKLANWKSTSEKWELVKNEDYWDAETVQLDKITFQVNKNTQTGIDLYEKGQIDRTGLSSDHVDVYSSDPDYTITPETSIFFIKMNQVRNGEETPLANENIRKAISMAFDKQAIVDEILNNGSIAATGIIPKDFVQVPETDKDFRATNGDLSPYNKEEAKKYWEQGLKELGVSNIELELIGDDSDNAKFMNEYLQNQLETNLEGLKVNLKSVPFEQRLDADSNQNYDLQVSGWGPDYLDPYTFLNLFVTDGGNNKMGYSNPEFDKLLEEAQTTYAQDQDKRYENFLKAEQALFDDAAIAPVYQRALAQLISPKVEGVIVNKFGATYEYKWASVGSAE